MGETNRTKNIKARLLKEYRFERGYYVGQEVDEKDIFAISKDMKESIEIEIKISKADLQNELHKSKHKLRHKIDRPTKFYFCVPLELEDDARDIIDRLNHSEYGVMDCDTFKILKRAKQISNDKINIQFRNLTNRLSSDIANKYTRLLNVESSLKWFVDDFIAERCKFVDYEKKAFVKRFYTMCFKDLDTSIVKGIVQTQKGHITTITSNKVIVTLAKEIKCNKYYYKLHYKNKDNNYDVDSVKTIVERIKEYTT